MSDLFGNGRISSMQIPTANVRQSGAFYAAVFGWNVHGGDDNHLSFDDATGDMIHLTPSVEPRVLPYIYVDGIDVAVERITSNGGQIVRPPYPEGDMWVATFRDPAGNLMGIWQKEPR